VGWIEQEGPKTPPHGTGTNIIPSLRVDLNLDCGEACDAMRWDCDESILNGLMNAGSRRCSVLAKET
jgi:hypothetical protein